MRRFWSKLCERFFNYYDPIASYVPSRLGFRIRYAAYSRRANFGVGVLVEPLVTIKFCKNLSVGDNSYIGKSTFIQAAGNVSIGQDVLVGPNCKIWSANHEFKRIDMPIRKQGHVYKAVSIGSDVWLGAGAIILPGVSLGDGVVVGAGSVVTKSFPNHSVIAGNPAKLVAKRD